jgi:hypothetical protein
VAEKQEGLYFTGINLTPAFESLKNRLRPLKWMPHPGEFDQTIPEKPLVTDQTITIKIRFPAACID